MTKSATIPVRRSKGTASLALPEVTDLRNVVSLRLAMVSACKSGRVRVNGASVERFTAAGVQVMLAAERTLNEAGGKLIVAEPSESLSAAFEVLGLTDALDRWAEA